MELPKNITQIGESDQHCKVYVEDYVISYIKQMNQTAENKEVAIALYGKKQEENEMSYVFFYGAGRIESLQKELRHLSQAQLQEIDKLRRRFFVDYQFLGYVILRGEMVEGFYVNEQGTCRYISGYACFYEKNDTMLAYMLDSRKEEVPPENVDQEKYERVKLKQEERRSQYRDSLEKNRKDVKPFVPRAASGNEEKKTDTNEKNGRIIKFEKGKQRKASVGVSASLKGMRTAVVGLFLVLCILGITTFGGESGKDIQTAAQKIIAEFTEQKLPDTLTTDQQIPLNQTNTLMTEDKLTDAIIQENAVGQAQPEQTAPEQEQPNTQPSNAGQEQPNNQSGSTGQEQPNAQPSDTGQEQQNMQQDNERVPADKQPVGTPPSQDTSGEGVTETVQQSMPATTYIIKKGDTLTSISIRNYGTDNRVKDICTLNNITNPDNIRFGQKILLP